MTAVSAAPSPWVLAGSPTALGDPTSLVTLVDGQTFCLSSRSGDFDSNPAHGVYFADMRVLSRAHLRIGGCRRRAAGGPAGRRRHGDVRRSVCSDRPSRGQPARGSPSPRRQRVARADRAAQLQPEPDHRSSSSSRSRPTSPTCSRSRKGREELEGEHSVEVQDTSMAFRWRLGDINRQAELSVTGPRRRCRSTASGGRSSIDEW